MRKWKYSKIISVEPWYEYLKQDENWEIHKVEIKISWTDFIKSKKHFMKVFQNQTLFAKEIWEDYKYLSAFFDIIMFDNSFHLSKFQELCWINPSNFSRLKKRLIDKWIIAEQYWVYYLNPAIAIRSDIINYNLMDLFKEKNYTIYKINEL